MADHAEDQPLAASAQARPNEAGAVDPIVARRAANRFDIRRIIGALFCLYAAILIVTGITGGHDVKTKAAGINIDLWTGLAMAAFGVFMIAWALSRPVQPEPDALGEVGAHTPAA